MRLKAKLSHAKKNVTQAMQPSQVVSLTILLKCCGQKKSDINYPDHVFGMLVTKTHFS
jgi:hypothetical protein